MCFLLAARASIVVFFSLCEVSLCGKSRPLGVKIAGALSENDMAEIRSIAHRASSDTALRGNRSFGVDGVDGVSHQTLFLHSLIGRGRLRRRLEDLAIEADKLAGWGLLQSSVPTARCLEVLNYEGAREDYPVDWHVDGGTLVTMVVMLSLEGSFDGGVIEMRDGNHITGNGLVIERYDNLRPGDLVAWRGWTPHRATAVTRGRREVFAAEWWLGEECADSGNSRPEDSVADLRRAVSLEPTASQLQLHLGRLICEFKPCANVDEAREAEHAYRQANALRPDDMLSRFLMKDFLRGYVANDTNQRDDL